MSILRNILLHPLARNEKFKDVHYACFISSTHALLIYLLLFGKKQAESTFFFVSDAISCQVQNSMRFCEELSYNKYINGKNPICRFLSKSILYRLSYYCWPFLKRVPIFGFDHLWFSSALLHNRKMVVLEDGLANTSFEELIRTTRMKHKWLYKLAYGPLMCKGEYGYSDQVDKVILTDAIDSCDFYKKSGKAYIINLFDLWLDYKDKEFITKFFDLTAEDISLVSSKSVLLLTQPYEDEISENRLIELYNNVLKLHRASDVLIKTHPRDNVNYGYYFPSVSIFSKKVPAELFALICNNITDVYTIDSTAIMFFPKTVKRHYITK